MTTPAGAAPSADPELSVVVPVHNNAAALPELITRTVQVLDGLGPRWEIIAVDDGSTDDSAEILRQHGRADERVRCVMLRRNFGSQAATCAGFDHARGQRIVTLDADLENYPEDIPALLAALDRGSDLAFGWRTERADPLLARRTPSWLVNVWIRRRVGAGLHDIGCGMRALDARLVRNLVAEGERRRALAPLLVQRAQRVTEVPIRHRRAREPSRYSFLALAAIAADYYLLSARRPFLIGGLVCSALAAVGMLLMLARTFRGPTPLLLAGAMLTATGLLGVLVSLLGEYAQRSYQLRQDQPFYELRDADTTGS